MVSPHLKQPLGDLLLFMQNLCKAQNFLASKAHQKLRPKKIRQTLKQSVGEVSIMTTNTITSNQSFTSKRSIMVRTTFARQFMRF
jgi:hypothetical protein